MRGRPLAKFLVVGGGATLLHYVILVVLVQLAHAPPAAASAIGYGVSALLNYWLNYRFTFRSSAPHARSFSRFLIVAASGAAINSLLVWTLHDVFLVHYMIAQVAATLVVVIWNFNLSRAWTY